MQIRVENVVKKYGNVEAIKNISLSVKSGALHFFLGPSGCGKTTMLRLIAGLEEVSGGKIYFEDRDVTKLEASERGIGMVFQNYALWPHMTVRKNIEYGLTLRKLSSTEVQKRVGDVLALTQLQQYADRLPGQLSGGQQQRVALARALAIRPNVLLLDEPLSNLDAKLRLEMRDNISRIHAQTGITTIYVTHDQKEALSMATQVSIMRNGHMIQSAPARTIYHDPSTLFIAGFIGEINFVEATYVGPKENFHIARGPAGDWICRKPDFDVKPGGKVFVAFRPESVYASFINRPHPTGNVNERSVTIDSLTYLGDSEQIALHDPHGAKWKAVIFNTPDHHAKVGDQAKVWIAPEDVMILPHEDDLASGT